MKMVCDERQCVGCMACLEVCSKQAITIKDELKHYNAYIDISKCIECSACKSVCQNNIDIKLKKPIAWFQGWTLSEADRQSASSGGIATAIGKKIVRRNGIVCSCMFDNGVFCFDFAFDEKKIEKFSGSKYVKSNPGSVYKKIKKYLKEGKEVLFIGLPCQVAALKIYIDEKYRDNLYLVDLICHGTPSFKNFLYFLNNIGYTELDEIFSISFRNGNKYQIRINDSFIEYPGVYDPYTLSFLNCINLTERCYSCSFATSDRISDITIGDSWGSELSSMEREKGVSLILCQSDKGIKLLRESGLQLYPVDSDVAVRFNNQLEHPSPKPDNYEKFFNVICSGGSYKKAVKVCLKKAYRHQQIKRFFIKAKVIRNE